MRERFAAFLKRHEGLAGWLAGWLFVAALVVAFIVFALVYVTVQWSRARPVWAWAVGAIAAIAAGGIIFNWGVRTGRDLERKERQERPRTNSPE